MCKHDAVPKVPQVIEIECPFSLVSQSLKKYTQWSKLSAHISFPLPPIWKSFRRRFPRIYAPVPGFIFLRVRRNLPSLLNFVEVYKVIVENNDLHICGMFAYFMSKFNLCTFDGVMCAH